MAADTMGKVSGQGDAAGRRAGPPTHTAPIWPGMEGGRYKPLTDRDVERVHAASLDLLEQVGLAGATDAWRDRVVAAGGRLTETGRLCFPRGLVEDCIDRAGRNFFVCGRDPKHDLDVSGARVHFGGGSATIQILDAHTNRFRETTLLDLYDISRLEDALDTMHFVMRACIARDLDDPKLLDINTAYAIMSATAKHFATSFFQPEHLEMAVAMFDLSLGGDGSGARWRARPFTAAIVTFVVPPLRLAPSACRVLDAAARHDMPAILCSAGQAGTTAPTALAGALTQGNAEVLAALTAMNLLKPGHPLFMANWPFVSDLRTGAFAGGGGEMALLAAASAQMARFYDIPSNLGTGMSSSKQPDLQAGWEKGYLATLPALAGGNMIAETTGVLADIIACSPEAFLLDSDLLSGVQRAVRGIEVTDGTLSVEDIKEVVAGPGHFLEQPSTLRFMKSEYVYPKLADRQTIQAWQDGGRVDIRARGLAALTRIMQQHYPQYVDPAADARIRQRFDIRLRREDQQPGNGRW